MSQTEILSEFEQLSVFQQLDLLKEALMIVEQHVRGAISNSDKNSSLAEAARLLLADYESDEELTAFSSLDGEDFYATG